MEKNKDLKKEAALAALQSLLITTAAAPEDLVNDALNLGSIFALKFVEQRATEVTEELPVFLPEDDRKFYYPKKSRTGYIVECEIWKHTRSQLALQQLHLCYNDEIQCMEHCKLLNTAYVV